MQQITIQLPDKRYESLQYYAEVNGLTIAEAVRQAIETFLATERRKEIDRLTAKQNSRIKIC